MVTSKTILYDTTLRDGTQREGISLSAQDKLKIAKRLDAIGIDYIEGGWPGSNPKDIAFFKLAKKTSFFNKKLVAFTATRHKSKKVTNDPNLQAVLDTKVKTVTMVGKTWDLHVRKALGTTLQENLKMIEESVRFFKKKGLTVFYDAEHLFDGFRANSNYAMQTLLAAERGGVDCIILCDTNGGSTPETIVEIIKKIQKEIHTEIGIHPHNDSEFGNANAFAAYHQGIRHIQGTINGYGERCGNANLCSIIANLKLKYNDNCISNKQLKELSALSHFVSEICNLSHDNHLPYVGKSAFTHKGGLHASAMAKDPMTYQHIDPEIIGNKSRTLVSELAGRSNVLAKAKQLGITITPDEAKVVVKQIKTMESRGFQFESADASFELLLRRTKKSYKPPFEIIDYLVLVEQRKSKDIRSEARVNVKIKNQLLHTVAEGNGPVNALDKALRKALKKAFPKIASITLHDYKVRILDETEGTEAQVRVLIESGNEKNQWTTVGSSPNITEASFFALIDSLEYGLLKS